MRIAIIGQSQFAANVFKELIALGHEICGVFTIEDKNGREDALAVTAQQYQVPLFKVKRWRFKGELEQTVFDQYCSTKPDLNVLPYCSQFIPMQVIDYPKFQSIVYHPSILPRHRGASAINWTLIEGDQLAGFTVFWADDGLDTGPILLQRSIEVTLEDTVDTLYSRFLFPEGVKGVVEAVQLIATGQAPKIVQSEQGATYDAMLNKAELQELPLKRKPLTALEMHNFVRGLDKVPGAWITIDGEPFRLFGSRLVIDKRFYELYDEMHRDSINFEHGFGRRVQVQGEYSPSYITDQGLVLFGSDRKAILIERIKSMAAGGRMLLAAQLGSPDAPQPLQFTEDELRLKEQVRAVFADVLRLDSADQVEDGSNFFENGAGSMDVTRLAEELKELLNCEVLNDDIYMEPEFGELFQRLVRKLRSNSTGSNGSAAPQVPYDGVEIEVRGRTIRLPTQPFINGRFVNVRSSSNKPRDFSDIVNPSDESVICRVQKAGKFEVELAVNSAYNAFQQGDWGKMNARDRGKLLNRLADLMEQRKEELAMIESIDSGAVYTLAVKTHIGMSIDAFRYFAGWTDKIHGKTIPINHNRPSRDMCLTRREPFGVCSLITPWNYPLMMVAWKASAALAAGNTLVVKPPAVCPLTVLKLAELTHLAGFPPGVFNVLPGSGATIGQLLAEHRLVDKVGFTGSTEIGKQIMASCSAPTLKKCSLELGGKSPLVIFSDCDLDKAVRNALQAVFFNKGENCIAAGRIFVQSTVHDEFVQKVIAETRKLKIGDPLDRSTSHGPQNHKAHLDKLLDYVAKGEKEGARLEIGGRRVDRPGYFFEPTIFTQVKDGSFLATEESFGPIMCISSFVDLNEVLERCNNSEYGLASGVFTNQISVAMQFAERIAAGTCFVNCYNKTDVAAPFGGFKQSGFGKDLGEDALSEYLRTKTITIEY